MRAGPANRAREALGELRQDFGWLEPGSTAIVKSQSGTRWWTFGGLYANAAIAAYLKATRGYAVSPNNLAIKIAGEPLELESALRQLREMPPETLLPEVSQKALDGLKFSACLPVDLAARVLQMRTSDVPAVERVLAEPARWVTIAGPGEHGSPHIRS